MKKKNMVILFHPQNVRGDTVIPTSIEGKFIYIGVSSRLSQERNLYGIVTIKDLEKYRDFFDQYHVPMKIIHRLLSEYQARITVKKKVIEVDCKGDRWRILIIENDQVLLQHNNYVKGFYGGRYYDEGYHTQRKSSFVGALKYIMKYNYKQIHCPEEVIQNYLKKALTESLTSRYEAFFESEEKSKRNIKRKLSSDN